MNKIYLVRHGENRANVTHEFSCKHVDYSLTAKGVLQAQQTAAYFKDKEIDEIFASPLKRAKETAEIIAEPLGLPVTIYEHFREVNVGDFEHLPPTLENWQAHDNYFKEWFMGNYELAFPGGENWLSLVKRMQDGLYAATYNKSGRTIVVAAHGGIFIASVAVICNVKLEELIRHPNHNCAITEIELSTDAHGVRGILKSWANYAHLAGEAAQFATSSPLLSTNEAEVSPRA